MLTSSPSTCFFVEEETPFYVKVRQRTVITSVQLDTPVSLPKGVYCIWACASPVPCRVAADASYAVSVPFILGSVTVSGEGGAPAAPTLPVPFSRWEVQPGTILRLHVAAASARAESVASAMAATRRRAFPVGHSPLNATTRAPRLPEPTSEAELSPLVTLRLCGALLAASFEDDQVEWVPFVTHRWFELADAGAAEATLVFRPPGVPAVEGRPVVSAEAAESYFSLLAGGVKEASGVDPDGAYVRWADGSIGLTEELKPYFRVFTPARREKVVRVRRFAHRNADVVGELPFGARVVAIGRRTDPFTGEDYALLVLPEDLSLTHLVGMYGLTSLSPSQWLWGWSKIAGSSGVPLLHDVTAAVLQEPGGLRPLKLAPPFAVDSSRARAVGSPVSAAAALPEASFFTPTRPGREVRIRRRASLRSEAVGAVDANEVKEAVRQVCVPAFHTAAHTAAREHRRPVVAPLMTSDAAPPTTFVEWKHGGFSVLSNGKEVFLRRVSPLAAPPPLALPNSCEAE